MKFVLPGDEEIIYVGDLVEMFGRGVRDLDSCLDILMGFYHSFSKGERPYIVGERLFMALDGKVGDLLNDAMEKDESLYNPYFNLKRSQERYAAFMDEVDEGGSKVNERRSELKKDKERMKKLKENAIPCQEDRFGRVYLNLIANPGGECRR